MLQTHSKHSLKNKIRFEAPPCALERYEPSIVAAKAGDQSVINIYSTIGDYGDGQGTTPRLVSSVLRKADGGDVVVNINSPGGDMFDGLAIHTLLSEYEGNVTVNVVGMAASAASIVAMAGDQINIAKAGFIMIHNSMTIVIGNKEFMREVADTLEKFDKAMAQLYSKKTKIEEKLILRMMDAETWLSGEEAIDDGFANAILGDDKIAVEDDLKNPYNAALKKIDVSLARSGMPRSERRNLIKELIGTPRAAPDSPTPSAGNVDLVEALKKLHATATN